VKYKNRRVLKKIPKTDVGPGMKKIDGSRRKSVGEVLEAK
jgi:hypothetical protein